MRALSWDEACRLTDREGVRGETGEGVEGDVPGPGIVAGGIQDRAGTEDTRARDVQRPVYDVLMSDQLDAAAAKAPGDADALQSLILGADTWSVA